MNVELQALTRIRTIKKNDFVSQNKIPLGIDRKKKIVTIPYTQTGALGIIGMSGSGKSVLLKRVYSYYLYFYNKKFGMRRPGIIFDLQSEDHHLSSDQNSKPRPLFYKQGERPIALKNLVCYAPTFTEEDKHKFDKLFGFGLNKVEDRDMMSLGLSVGAIRTLQKIIANYPDKLNNPREFFDLIADYPTMKTQLKNNEFYTDTIYPSIKESIMLKFFPVFRDNVLIAKDSEYYKENFIEDLKNGKIICINFHQVQEYMSLYVGMVLRDIFFKRRECWRNKSKELPEPVIVVEEADLCLNAEDNDLNKGSTRWMMEILRRGRKFGFFSIISTQEASALHPQIKFHTRQWLISNLVHGDVNYFKNIFSKEVMDKVKSLSSKKNSWGASEWAYIYNNGKSIKTFFPYHSPVEINRGGSAV